MIFFILEGDRDGLCRYMYSSKHRIIYSLMVCGSQLGTLRNCFTLLFRSRFYAMSIHKHKLPCFDTLYLAYG